MPVISEELFEQKYGNYFPSEARSFVFSCLNRYNFSFKVTSPRATKKGDFRFHLTHNRIPQITVNRNLCTYEFLLVFLHELAHFFVFVKYPKQVKSHGNEWKTEYRGLLNSVIESVQLPQDIIIAWRKHLKNIKSSSAIDPHLNEVFDKYRDKPADEFFLKELTVGECFVFRNDVFRLDSFARTRATCTLLRNKRKYLISGMAPVLKHTSL